MSRRGRAISRPPEHARGAAVLRRDRSLPLHAMASGPSDLQVSRYSRFSCRGNEGSPFDGSEGQIYATEAEGLVSMGWGLRLSQGGGGMSLTVTGSRSPALVDRGATRKQ